MIVRNDAAATAANILGSESLFRLGFAADLLGGLTYIGVSVLLYDLLKPVNRSLSLLAAFFGLAGVASGAGASVTLLAPLVLSGGAPYLTGFTTDQVQGLAYAFLRLHAQAFNVAMVFFGFQCMSAGYLIARSTFLPRILGVLLAVGGLSYVINSLASFVSPTFAGYVAPFILPLVLLGEGSLTAWLIVKGVDAQRWNEHTVGATYGTVRSA